MSVNSYDDLRQHIGHKIVCACYGDGKKGSHPENVAIECETCSVVLLDYNRPEEPSVAIAVFIDKDGKPKGIQTAESLQSEKIPDWVTAVRSISVPKADWDAEKINITNIKEYL